MGGIAKVATQRTCRTGLAAALLLLASAASLEAHGQTPLPASAAEAAPRIPAVLHGFWDLAPRRCVVSPEIESDSRIEIRAGFVRGYEELMEVSEVQHLSESPPVWRILAISDIAPVELQQAAIYVLSGGSLTIVEGAQARSYVRCEVAPSGSAP